mgnify:FL=1
MKSSEAKDDDALLTLDAIADRLRVSKRHLAKIMAEGKGPPVVRIGRRVLVRPPAFRAWLIEQEKGQDARSV